MQKMVDKILRSYGSLMTLHHDGKSYMFRGFLQPGLSMSQRSAIKKISPLGEISGDTYLFIGPVEEPQAQIGDTLSDGEKDYELRQVEKMMYKNEPIYMWGLCVLKGGADTWGL